MSAALSTERLTRSWGALKAVDDFTFTLGAGARHALIGPNGAGKTTLINLLTGYVAASDGEIFLGGEKITNLPQYRRVKRGITRTFQISHLFPGLTVVEALVLAVLERDGQGGSFCRPVSKHRDVVDEALTLLTSLRLDRDQNTQIRDLPYGKQRVLEIALALATRPRILLLDEPAAGVPVDESGEIFRIISALPRDVSILFIEHDMSLVFRFAERITVMAHGQILVEGTPDQVAADARVKEVYLGESAHD